MAFPFIFTLIIFIIPLMSLRPILSQDTIAPVPSPCGPRLLALAPCGPFVQGLAPSPAQLCCDSLTQLYGQQPSCLCLFLANNTSSFPINRTLALELPQLCGLPANSSACSALPSPKGSPGSRFSLGTKKNSTVAASPENQVAPRPISAATGFGLGRNSSEPQLKEIRLTILTVAAFIIGIFLLI